jgi:phage host-nuclease inhibitor protein Gam
MVRSTKKLKTQASPVSVPQTRDAVADAISQIGIAQRHRQRIEAAMNDEIAATKLRFEKEAQLYNDQIQALRTGVQIWCEANRDALTQAGKVKFATFPSGEVKWRLTPPAVAVKAVKATIELLRKKGFTRFLREKTEINKDAVLAEKDAAAALAKAGIAGITIAQHEEFVIEPFETKLEEVA